MSQNHLVQARVNGEVKEQATVALAAMGLTVSDAVRMLLVRVATDKTLPQGLLPPNETTRLAMEGAQRGRVEPVTLDAIRAVIRAKD